MQAPRIARGEAEDQDRQKQQRRCARSSDTLAIMAGRESEKRPSSETGEKRDRCERKSIQRPTLPNRKFTERTSSQTEAPDRLSSCHANAYREDDDLTGELARYGRRSECRI